MKNCEKLCAFLRDKDRKNREANKKSQELLAETQDFDNIHNEMDAIRKFEADFVSCIVKIEMFYRYDLESYLKIFDVFRN